MPPPPFVHACMHEGKKLQSPLILELNPADLMLGKASSAFLEMKANSQG